MTRATLAVLIVVGLMTGCSEERSRSSGTLPPEDERVPITERAIAAIALRHLPDDTSSRSAVRTDVNDPEGLLAVDLRYGADGRDDGDVVRVAVQPTVRADPCGEGAWCEDLDTPVEGARLLLVWQEQTTRDPGLVAVVLRREGEDASVYQAGRDITGDPRELDLAVSVEQMIDVVEDPWLRLETSPEAVRAGEDLQGWED